MWYSANLLFKSVHSTPDEDALWEESIRLIRADTVEDALEKAQILGERERTSYVAKPGDRVTWDFVQVERVFEISDELLSDGSEIFSRFLRDSEVRSLLTPFAD